MTGRLRTITALLTPIIIAAVAAAPAFAEEATQDGVLTIGGSVTEIVYALGDGDRLIARDTTSTYPADVESLPDVGYMRALSPEGVLSIDPSLIISEEGAGPPEVVQLLKDAGIPFVTVPDAIDRAGIVVKIHTVGAALGRGEEANRLAAEVDAALIAAETRATALAGDAPVRVLFILSAEGGRIMASGNGTAAAGIIDLAGAINAVTAFEGYKLLTDEAVTASAPDVILMMDRGGDHGATAADLLVMPAVATTPAGENGAVVRLDGLYLLGFGPRTAQAVTDLTTALYGE